MNSSQPDRQSNAGTFIAIALCVVFYLAWTQYLNRKYPDHNKPKTAPEVADPQSPTVPLVSGAAPTASLSTATDAAGASPEAETPKAPRASQAELTFETNEAVFVLNQDFAGVSSVKLKGYKETNDPSSSAIELMHRPLSVEAQASSKASSPLKPLDYAVERQDNRFIFTRQDGPWKVTQEWTLPKTGYVAKLSTTWLNTLPDSQPLKPTVFFEMGARTDTQSHSFFVPGAPNEAPRVLSQFEGSDDFIAIEDFCKDQTKQVVSANKKLDFFGFDHHYFAAAIIPNAAASYRTTFAARDNNVCSVTTAVSADLGAIAGGQSSSLSWDAWFGPKEVELLSAFNPHLRTTLGLGWLDMIAHPMLLAIKGLYKFTGNYGIAIIVLTLLLKIIFFPLARQAAISAAKMKKLQPEMTKLREKYKSDPQRMQMELMKFMGQHKINPMKGCLPMLPTIPVFFALFRVLSASIDLRHAPFYGWIADLSVKDPYFVTPIILTGCMFVQQKMTPMTGMDPTQEKVMMMMPLIFGVMMISLPSGLVLYMLTNTIVTIAQQHFLNQKLAATI